MIVPQPGQRAFFPASSSRTCNCFPQPHFRRMDITRSCLVIKEADLRPCYIPFVTDRQESRQTSGRFAYLKLSPRASAVNSALAASVQTPNGANGLNQRCTFSRACISLCQGGTYVPLASLPKGSDQSKLNQINRFVDFWG